MNPIIYQVMPRYWGGYTGQNVRNGSLSENGCGHFADFDVPSLQYIKKLGCTHVWYTGIIRHATGCDTDGCTPSHPQFLKGKAGSPYAITDYYDVNPYLAIDPQRRMEEFRELVERTHAQGLKVIIDFVPNHVSRDNVNFGQDDDKSVHWREENDFFYYPGERLVLPVEFTPDSHFEKPYEEYPARATGNDCFTSHPSVNDWFETVKLNYCSSYNKTWEKMNSILHFWAEMGVDGFRCDMVELVPREYFKWQIAKLKEDFKDIIFIAEVYQKDLYRTYIRDVGFDLLYDKSGMYDTLFSILKYNAPASLLTGVWQSAGELPPKLLNFMENHDELRLASDFFCGSARKGIAALAVSALFNNAAFMIYSGGELGERGMDEEGFSGLDGRSTIFDWWKPESMRKIWSLIRGEECLDARESFVLEKYLEILNLARFFEESECTNYDLCYCNGINTGFNPEKHFAFLRLNNDICYLVVCNFSGENAAMTVNIPPKNRMEHVEVDAYSYAIVKL